MGCGGSKPEADDQTPVGLRPFRRRIEEIRRRRNGRTIEENVLSTKKLLKEGAEDEGSPADSIHDVCQKKKLTPPESDVSKKEVVDPVKEAPAESVVSKKEAADPVKEAPAESVVSKKEAVDPVKEAPAGSVVSKKEAVNPVEETPAESVMSKKEAVNPVKEAPEESVVSKEEAVSLIKEEPAESVASKKEAVNPVKEAPVLEPEVATAEEKVTEVGNDGGFSERDCSEIGFGDLPGSPSFREYYYASVRDSVDTDSSELSAAKGDAKSEDTSRRKESIESLNSSEELESKPLKRRRRFRALAKGPVAVYSLLNVRSCYNHPSSSHNDSPRLLCEKAA